MDICTNENVGTSEAYAQDPKALISIIMEETISFLQTCQTNPEPIHECFEKASSKLSLAVKQHRITEQSTLPVGQSVLSNERPNPDILVQVQTPTTSVPLDENSQAVLFQSTLVKNEPIRETKEECSKLTVPIVELNQVCEFV